MLTQEEDGWNLFYLCNFLSILNCSKIKVLYFLSELYISDDDNCCGIKENWRKCQGMLGHKIPHESVNTDKQDKK